MLSRNRDRGVLRAARKAERLVARQLREAHLRYATGVALKMIECYRIVRGDDLMRAELEDAWDKLQDIRREAGFPPVPAPERDEKERAADLTT